MTAGLLINLLGLELGLQLLHLRAVLPLATAGATVQQAPPGSWSTSRSTAATVMALVEKTFSHSLNAWLLVTNRDFRS